uniref:Uncharacterized protein n=1 Tax=Anguilla anguilla TaxID=7936 RepID=A0A0E9Q1I5_ANGAN
MFSYTANERSNASHFSTLIFFFECQIHLTISFFFLGFYVREAIKLHPSGDRYHQNSLATC